MMTLSSSSSPAQSMTRPFRHRPVNIKEGVDYSVGITFKYVRSLGRCRSPLQRPEC